MRSPAGTTKQDKNAGNLGDLLKHFWLLQLIERVLKQQNPGRIAYLESHAGAGRYELDKQRIRELVRRKRIVCGDDASWEMFDRYNPQLIGGVYFGSFVLALRRLADWRDEIPPGGLPERRVRVVLWECDPDAAQRIESLRCESMLKRPGSMTLRRGKCTPRRFADQVKHLTEDGYHVIWLCDPYWGKTKREDRVWWCLLQNSEVQKTSGMIFAYVRGNSRLRGPEKFDFPKTIWAPSAPCPHREEGICAYGLYLTEAARELLGPYLVGQRTGQTS